MDRLRAMFPCFGRRAEAGGGPRFERVPLREGVLAVASEEEEDGDAADGATKPIRVAPRPPSPVTGIPEPAVRWEIEWEEGSHSGRSSAKPAKKIAVE